MIALLKKEYLEVVRTKKMLILIIIFLFVAISSPILAKLLPTLLKNMPSTPGLTINIPEPTWHDALDQFVKNISQIAMIVLVFLFAGMVAEEKNKKTLEMILTKPISRVNLVISKYLSAFISTIVIYSACALIFYGYTVSLFGSFSIEGFCLMAGLILLYLLQAIAVTIFASTLSSNQIIAAGVAFFFEFIIVTILGSIGKISSYMPGYILGHYKEIMSGNHGGFLPSTLVTLGLIIVSAVGAILIFRRQEIER